MLVLTRSNEKPSILIGEDIVIHVISNSGGQVKVGIEAPKNIEIWREEITLKTQQSTKAD